MTQETTRLAIRCRGLTKSFGNVVAVDDFDLDVSTGSLVGLLGPSGCGKTTLLRLIAGFEVPDSGRIEIGSQTVVDRSIFVPPERRRVGMVFQDYALFPHMNVARNISYGLSDDAKRGRRVTEVIDLVGLGGLDYRYPHELSGGQQQRVALARALAPQPEVILLDEPFSNLDAALRDRVRREMRAILSETETTAVFVTHDQEEALAMSDTVAVMKEGKIIESGTPHDLYLHPTDRWVAEFVGEADFVQGMAANGQVVTEFGTFRSTGDGPMEVMIRAEDVRVRPASDGEGEIVSLEFYGHDQLIWIRVASGKLIRSRMPPSPELKIGDRVNIEITSAAQFTNEDLEP